MIMKGFIKKVTANDMVFDLRMNPAWCNSPESCKRWLRFRLETDKSFWFYTVRVGATLKHMTVNDYLKGKG